MLLDFVSLDEGRLEGAWHDIERDPTRLRQHLERPLGHAMLLPKVAVDAMTQRRGLADIQDIATRPKHAIDTGCIRQREPHIARHRPYAPPALALSFVDGEPFMKCAPSRNPCVF